MELASLHELYVEGLRDLYSAEQQIVKALPKLQMGATNPKVKQLSLEVATELMRVTWPSSDDVRVSTIAVVVASLVAALILFGMDTLSYNLMVKWLPAVWGKLG